MHFTNSRSPPPPPKYSDLFPIEEIYKPYEEDGGTETPRTVGTVNPPSQPRRNYGHCFAICCCSVVSFLVILLGLALSSNLGLNSSGAKLSSSSDPSGSLQTDSQQGVMCSLSTLGNYNNGQGWHCKNGLPTTDVCSWSPGVTCNQLGQVISLELSYFGLTRTIPTNLGQLTTLTKLDLTSNKMGGKLPYSLGLMTALRVISLSSNSFSGLLPLSIADMSSLDHVGLSGNSFSGSIPATVCSLKSLRTIDLSHNDFIGSIPPCFTNLMYLSALDFEDNKLFGSFPTVFTQLPSLRSLNLASNSFAGSVPTVLGYLSGLSLLDLHDNSFVGSVPTVLGTALSNLLTLRLDGNLLSGSLPSSFCDKNLKSVQITSTTDTTMLCYPKCMSALLLSSKEPTGSLCVTPTNSPSRSNVPLSIAFAFVMS